jgi:hypothetical protein
MPKQIIIRVMILSVTFVAYLVFTTRYAVFLKKEILFTKRVKILHSILIWLIPFVWIVLLKALAKRTPGSYEIEEKRDPEPFSKDGGTGWTG